MNPFTNAKVIASGVNPAVYHQREFPRGHREFVMSRGEIMEFNHSPQGWVLGRGEESTPSTEFGSLVDTIVLSPTEFFHRFAIIPEDAPKKPSVTQRNAKKPSPETIAAIEWWDKWLLEHEGCVIVKPDMNGGAHTAAKRLHDDPKIAALLKCSDTQVYVTGEYHDKATGIVVPVKALLDIVPRLGSPFQKSLADLKTAKNAAAGYWNRACFDNDYHVQAAWYSDLYTAATGEDRTDWLHVIVENMPPYEPARRILDTAFVDLGRDMYIAALQRYCRCLAAGYWPGYDDDQRDSANGWTWTHVEPWMISRANGQLADIPADLQQKVPEPEEAPLDLIP